jgi:hypothetical protein
MWHFVGHLRRHAGRETNASTDSCQSIVSTKRLTQQGSFGMPKLHTSGDDLGVCLASTPASRSIFSPARLGARGRKPRGQVVTGAGPRKASNRSTDATSLQAAHWPSHATLPHGNLTLDCGGGDKALLICRRRAADFSKPMNSSRHLYTGLRHWPAAPFRPARLQRGQRPRPPKRSWP